MTTDHYHVLLDCKETYTSKFIQSIRPRVLSIINDSYANAKQKKTQSKDSKSILQYFQDNLKDIKEWDNNKITKEISNICAVNNIYWLDELIKAIFIANYKIINIIHVYSLYSLLFLLFNILITIPYFSDAKRFFWAYR